MDLFTEYSTPGRKEEILLSVKDLNLTYGKGAKAKPILSNINLQITDRHRDGLAQGQITSLIGRSGIGKSQLFRIIAGFNEIKTTDEKTMSGEVLINIEQKPVKLRDVGYVTQNYKLLEHRTVRKNLQFTGASNDQINDYCNQFDLLQHLDKYPMELSGGQRQRTAILQQVLVGNTTILLDEPFSGLDEIMLRKTINLLLKISLLNELQTLIIISHDIENSLAISDRAFLLTKEENMGATIKEENKFDLVNMGLAWNPNIKDVPQFRELLNTIKSRL
jgi:ABC-type nitrate/sulfonate/bicarbonate transport system ATPase subunit